MREPLVAANVNWHEFELRDMLTPCRRRILLAFLRSRSPVRPLGVVVQRLSELVEYVANLVGEL